MQHDIECLSSAEIDAGQSYFSNKATAIVQNLTEQEMRDFLLALAETDERISNRIVSQFSTPDIACFQAKFNAVIDAIWQRYEHGNFIDYRHTFDCSQDLSDAFLDAIEPLMREETLMEAFDLSYTFLLRLEDIDADGSDGFYFGLMYLCKWKWSEIISLAQQSPNGKLLQDSIAEKLCSFVKENPVEDYADIYEYLSEDVAEFLETQFGGNVSN